MVMRLATLPARLTAWLEAFGPVRLAFLGSLLLSFVAVVSRPVLNRDGMLYIDTARIMLDQGMAALRNGFDWQFLPVLIAGIGAATGLPLEIAGHALNALLLAGACALLVSCTRRRLPEAAWAACLVVLAMPAYNGYRNEILREFGFWFFCMLAFWLAMRWTESYRWREAIACQLALGCAVLFRLEAAAFYPALMLWQAFSAPAGQRPRRVMMIGGLALAGVVLAAVLFGGGLVAPPGRLTYYLEAADPLRKMEIFGEAARRMTETVLNKYSMEEAAYVLFFGLLTIIPVKFVKMSGVFILPMLYAFAVQPLRAALARWQPLPWAFFVYALVLVAFVTHQFFLVGRYVSLLNLLVVPPVAVGLRLLMLRFPRWRALMLGLALLTMAANVISLSPQRTQVVSAGKWLAANAADASRVYVGDPRVAYYAGWGFSQALGALKDRTVLARELAENRYDMVVLEASRKHAGVEEWMAANRLQPLKRFANRSGDAVVVAVPAVP